MEDASQYIVWEGAGWYALSTNPKGNRLLQVGADSGHNGHRAASDKARQGGYSSPQWYGTPPVSVTLLTLEQFRELVIARRL